MFSFHVQLLPIERAAKKEKKLKETMGLGSDDEEEEDDDDDDDEEDKKSDADMDEEDTLQTNIDEMDQFRLPGKEETEKEGQCLTLFSSFFFKSNKCDHFA